MLAVTSGSEQLTRAMRSLEAAFLVGVEGVTEIWLVRHADCYHQLVEADDPPLSSIGRDQAKRLAERVRRAGVAAVYASPYRRAMETARAITDDVRVDPRLVEMELEVSPGDTFQFTEEPASVSARMAAALAEMSSAHAGRRVVAITHAAAIIACLTDLMQLEPGGLRILPYYTSVSIVRALGDRRMVGAIGDAAHLE